MEAVSPPPNEDDVDAVWVPGVPSREDQIAIVQARGDHSAIVEDIPTQKDNLGIFSVLCLLLNRMVGEWLPLTHIDGMCM